jgi:hypothetical protein
LDGLAGSGFVRTTGQGGLGDKEHLSHRFIAIVRKTEINAGTWTSVGTSLCTNDAPIMYFVDWATLAEVESFCRIQSNSGRTEIDSSMKGFRRVES